MVTFDTSDPPCLEAGCCSTSFKTVESHSTKDCNVTVEHDNNFSSLCALSQGDQLQSDGISAISISPVGQLYYNSDDIELKQSLCFNTTIHSDLQWFQHLSDEHQQFSSSDEHQQAKTVIQNIKNHNVNIIDGDEVTLFFSVSMKSADNDTVESPVQRLPLQTMQMASRGMCKSVKMK